MLAAERRQIIAERLQAAGRVMVGELSGEFGVSEETIRRDLEWLESEGVAKRTYGGAVPCGGGKAPPPYAVRKNTNVEGKLVIAQLAAALVEEAVSSLAQAKAMHDDLEGIYNPHVNFALVEEFAQKLWRELQDL